MAKVKENASFKDFIRDGKPYNMHQQHWEIQYKEKPKNDRVNQIMGSDFNPTQSKDRYKTYIPVNETDT
jgi:hypothetical protein